MNKVQMGIVTFAITVAGFIGGLVIAVRNNGQERGEVAQRLHETERRLDQIERRQDYYFGKGERP